ncbi:MAG: coiled-coil domain-containing protein [Candidatus Helarchaeales archaeon]
MQDAKKPVFSRNLEEQEQLVHQLEREFSEELEGSRHNLAISDEQVQIFKSKIEEKDNELTKIKEELKRYESIKDKLEQEIKQKDEKIITLEAELKSANENIEKTLKEKEAELEKVNAELSSLKENVENEIKQSYDELIDRQTKIIKNKKEEIEKLDEKIKDISELSASLERENARLKEELEKLKDKIENQQSTILEKNDQILDLKDEVRKLNETIASLQDKLESTKEKSFKYIQGREQLIEIMNEALSKARMRILIITPTIKDLESLNFSLLSDRVSVRVATFVDKNEEDQELLRSFMGRKNFSVRNFPRQDRWGLEFDREGLVIATHAENVGPIGFYLSEYKQIELYLTLLSEAWVQGRPI